MRAIYLIALRNLIYRPGRSISCALGIALGLAIVMAVLIVDRNTILSQSIQKPDAYGEPDIEIKPLQPKQSLIEAQRLELERCEGIHSLTGLYFNDCRIRSLAGKEIDLQVCGLDQQADTSFKAYRVEEGDGLDFIGPPNILLSRKAAKRLQAKPGDLLQVWYAVPTRTLCKDGQVVRTTRKREPRILDFRVRGILAEENLGRRNLALVPFDQGLELFEGSFVLPIFWAKIAPDLDLTRVRTLLKDRFSVDKPSKQALVGESLEEKAFRNGVRVCAMLSLLLGLYIIFNSMSMSLVQRIRQIGLLRALGITRSGLAGIFLLEGFMLTLIGTIFSIGLTVLIVAFMKWMNITTLGHDYDRSLEIVEVPWLQLGGVVVLGTFFSLLGVVYPIGKASSLSVIQAIRKGTIEFEKQPFKGLGRILFFLYVLLIPVAYYLVSPLLTGRTLEMFLLILNIGIAVAVVIGLLLFFPILLKQGTAWVLAPLSSAFAVTGRLARTSMHTARLRVFSTVSGLTLVFAAIFVIVSVKESLLSETATWADQNLVGNVFIRAKKTGDLKPEELQNIEGVKAVNNLSASIRSPFPVRGLAPEELVKYGPFEGRKDLARDIRNADWIIISTTLAKTYHYQVNDRLKLSTPLAGQKVFRVFAISDKYGFYPDDRIYAVISLEKMRSYFCVTGDSCERWSLYLDEGASPKAVADLLKERLGDRAQITQGVHKKKAYLYYMRRDFFIFTVIISLVALLAGISILNSLVIAVVERRRETALLRVVGLTPNQLRGILLLEAFGLGVLGGLFGVLLGWPLTVLTIQGLKRISHLDLEVMIQPGTVLLTFFGALIVSLGAALYPIFRQSTAGLMEAIKYE